MVRRNEQIQAFPVSRKTESIQLLATRIVLVVADLAVVHFARLDEILDHHLGELVLTEVARLLLVAPGQNLLPNLLGELVDVHGRLPWISLRASSLCQGVVFALGLHDRVVNVADARPKVRADDPWKIARHVEEMLRSNSEPTCVPAASESV